MVMLVGASRMTTGFSPEYVSKEKEIWLVWWLLKEKKKFSMRESG